jgi:ATP-dependent Clp protease ATP-binding subunit ClpX
MNKKFDLNNWLKKKQDFSESKGKKKVPLLKKGSHEWDINGERLEKISSIEIELGKKILGQEKAKKIIATCLFRHLSRERVELKRSPLLIVGPTGTGKTALANSAANILNAPIVHISSPDLVPSAYRGVPIESIFSRLIEVANGNIELAEKSGIIFLDEIDKLNTEIGKQVQSSLLKILEGAEILVNYKKNDILFKTHDIFFILAGVFQGDFLKDGTELKKIGLLYDVEKNKNGPYEDFSEEMIQEIESVILGLSVPYKSIEESSSQSFIFSPNTFLFEKQKDSIFSKIKKELIDWGMLPEFVGRVTDLAMTYPISLELLREILCDEKLSPLRDFKNLLEIHGVSMSYNKGWIEKIIRKSSKSGLGVRGLQSAVQEELDQVLYHLSKSKSVNHVELKEGHFEFFGLD